MSWLPPELLGLRKREDGRGAELRSLRISELSAVDDPAHGCPDWILMKSASPARTQSRLERYFPGFEQLSLDEARQLRDLLRDEPDAAEEFLQKRASRSWGQRLVAGQTIRFS